MLSVQNSTGSLPSWLIQVAETSVSFELCVESLWLILFVDAMKPCTIATVIIVL